MKLRLALLAVAACGSSKSEPSCGARVSFVRVGGRDVVLRFENVSTDTIKIGWQAVVVDVDGNATSVKLEPFSLPADSHREGTITLPTRDAAARIDRIEIPESGPEPWMCTIRASGLAKGRSLAPQDDPDTAQAMAKMRELTDAMCKCADKACADRVTDDMTKWSQNMARQPRRNTKVTQEDAEAMQAVTEEFTRCATKAMTAGMGGSPDKLPF